MCHNSGLLFLTGYRLVWESGVKELEESEVTEGSAWGAEAEAGSGGDSEDDSSWRDVVTGKDGTHCSTGWVVFGFSNTLMWSSCLFHTLPSLSSTRYDSGPIFWTMVPCNQLRPGQRFLFSCHPYLGTYYRSSLVTLRFPIKLVHIHFEVCTAVNVTSPKVVDFCKAVEYAIHVCLCQHSYQQRKVATVRSAIYI